MITEATASRRVYVRNLLALACMASLNAAPVFAQEASPSEGKAKPKQAVDLEAVTVTGSRVSNPNIISPTPNSVITADDIKAIGATNIGDIMTQAPQLATTFTMGNSSRFIGTAGVQPIDLRNLGTSRTLVLVNGRRFVGATAGDTAVDVNQIPADWVERVEIITGGASAVYGADAVTGVVNFILKKNYTGANLHVQYGTSEHGGFNKKLISLTAGTNFAQDRGNVAISFEHSDQDSLEFGDRFGHQSYSSILTPNGPTDSALFPNAGGYTTLPGGTFAIGRNRYVFNPDGSVRPQNLGAVHDNRRCQDCDRIDTNQVLQLQPNYKRNSLSAVGSFNITPEHRLYAEGSYSQVKVKQYGQPSFGTYTINRDNAYVSPSLGALMDGQGLDSIDVSRFNLDEGRRGEDTRRTTYRTVLGANGVITGDWEYDASLVYGVTRESRHNLNNMITDRFSASIDAVRNSSGNIVCRSSLDPSGIDVNSFDAQGNPRSLNPIALGGCVPTSIFGAGALNPTARDWFNTVTTTRSKVTQFVGGGTVTNNNLFQMPGDAGSASLVAGIEFRRESSKQINDLLDRNGLTFLNAIPNSSGAYNVKEGYLEFAAPLLGGLSFAKNLTFDAAARFSDYSTIGHTKAWRWGLDWSIDDNVRLRGTMSSAVRAPNIGELFGGQSQNFGFVTDPCSSNQIANGASPAVRAANCAALGIPGNYQSANSATVGGLSGSNPKLGPEQGRTWTAGVVFTPQFIEGFGLSLDYWNIKLTDAITLLDFQTVADHCADAAAGIGNLYCRSTTRDPSTHEITNVTAIYQNISALQTSGVDIGAYYSHSLGRGKLQFNLDATKVIAYTEHPFPDDPSSAIQDNGTLGFPKWKAVLRTTYAIDNWVFNLETRFFSRMLRVTNESYKSNPTQTAPIYAASGFFNDVRASYTLKNSGWQIYAGITNVFDRDPPKNLYGTGSGAVGLGSALYDALGRSYYAGFNYQF